MFPKHRGIFWGYQGRMWVTLFLSCPATVFCRCQGGGLLASFCSKKELSLLELSSAPAWLLLLSVLARVVRWELDGLWRQTDLGSSPALSWVTLCFCLFGLPFSHLCNGDQHYFPARGLGHQENSQSNTGCHSRCPFDGSPMLCAG